jgi:pimeloyl-ACP methyl ester carboxylesterase
MSAADPTETCRTSSQRLDIDMTKPIVMGSVEFIEVDGLKIRFQRHRVSEGIPLVLTSPWPESLYAFRRVWPILGAEASLIAVDLPGFGQSEGRPQLMSPRAMGAFIPKFLSALSLDRVHAVAPDVGTSALLFAANARPDLFESLVVGSGATDAALAAGTLKDLINAPSTAPFEATSGDVIALGAIDQLIKVKPDPLVLKDYQASSVGRRFVEAMAYVRAYPADLSILRAELPSIRTPVLSVWGVHDPLVPPENAEVLNRALPRTRSLLLECGHFVWEDCADEYATEILEWVRDGYKAI